MKIRVLLLSFYYPPDLSAGSFRAESLIYALIDAGRDRLSVDVVTTTPNRYSSYQPSPEAEKIPGDKLKIVRIELPAHQSGLLDQALAYRRYAAGVLKATRGSNYDLVIATSSRLMTALLGAYVARGKHARLYLDIRDIFAELMPELTPRPLRALIAPVLSWCEKWAIKRSDRVNLVSPGFEPWFAHRYPGKEFSYFTNGIDSSFILADGEKQYANPPDIGKDRPLTIVYAGNIGQGQGLHHIIPALAQRLRDRAVFHIIGAGGKLDELRKACTGLTNVVLTPPLERAGILKAYHSADVLFLHLNDQQALRRVQPSKLFEYAASGKPIWAGVAGYAAQFIAQEIDNAAVFLPCDAEAAIQALDKLVIETLPRKGFVSRYSRETIMKQMAREILELTEPAEQWVGG